MKYRLYKKFSNALMFLPSEMLSIKSYGTTWLHKLLKHTDRELPKFELGKKADLKKKQQAKT